MKQLQAFARTRTGELRYRAVLHYLGRYRAELLTSLAALAGWGAITHGVVRALDASWLWWISGGLLLLGLVGYRLLLRVLRDGLYVLSRDDDTTTTTKTE